MVRVVNVSNFDRIVELPEQWHRKILMIGYSIQTISFLGFNIIFGVIGRNYERSLPVDRSSKQTLSYSTEELWHLQIKTNKDFI